MNEFTSGFILSYFKNHQKSYSFTEIARLLGMPLSEISTAISDLLEKELLAYNDRKKLALTPQGRMALLNKQEDYLSTAGTSIPLKTINPNTAIPLDKIYLPKNFLAKYNG